MNTNENFPMVPNNTFTYNMATRTKTDYTKPILKVLGLLLLLALIVFLAMK